MEYITVSAKTLDDAITEALIQLGVTSDQLDYQVIEKGSAGFLGIGMKQAVIKARKKEEVKEEEPEIEIPKVDVSVVKEPVKKENKNKKEAVKKEQTVVESEPASKAAKKPAVKAKKAVKEPVVPELVLQFDDNGANEANLADVVSKIKAAYVAEGHRESSIKTLRVYLKPQDWKAYYVINNKIEGQIDLF